MIHIKTDNSEGKIFKSLHSSGLEFQKWEIRNQTNFAKMKVKSAHFHDEFQVGYLHKGCLENTYRGVKEIIEPNKLYFIQPNEIHAENALTKEGSAFNFVFIPKQLMSDLILEITNQTYSVFQFAGLLVGNKTLNDFLLKRFKVLVTALENDASEIEQSNHLLDFIESASTNLRSAVLPARTAQNDKKTVKLVKEYLSENLSENISLGTLSKETNTSKFHLLRQFRKETGITIHRYLIQLKICKAKEFLKSGKSSAETAFELGFADQAHFNNCFKRFTSQTPGQFYQPKKFRTDK